MNFHTFLVSCAMMLLVDGQHASSWNEPEVAKPPSFKNTSTRVDVREGSRAILECSINNLGTKKVAWRRKSESNPLTVGKDIFVPDPRFSIQHVPLTPEWLLIIDPVRSSDENLYECQVASQNKKLRRYVTLNVLPSLQTSRDHLRNKLPGITMIPERKAVIEKDQTLTLKCNATAYGKDFHEDLDWFFDGQKLQTDSNVEIRKHYSIMQGTIQSELQIRSVDMSNAGTYICRASEKLAVVVEVHVLNADTKNYKRGTEKNTSGDKTGRPRHDSLDTPDRDGNSAGRSSLPLACCSMALLVCLVHLLTTSLTTQTLLPLT